MAVAKRERTGVIAAGKPRARLSELDIAQLRIEALVSISAIRAWARGDKVEELTDARIRRAMTKLGMKALS